MIAQFDVWDAFFPSFRSFTVLSAVQHPAFRIPLGNLHFGIAFPLGVLYSACRIFIQFPSAVFPSAFRISALSFGVLGSAITIPSGGVLNLACFGTIPLGSGSASIRLQIGVLKFRSYDTGVRTNGIWDWEQCFRKSGWPSSLVI